MEAEGTKILNCLNVSFLTVKCHYGEWGLKAQPWVLGWRQATLYFFQDVFLHFGLSVIWSLCECSEEGVVFCQPALPNEGTGKGWVLIRSHMAAYEECSFSLIK